MVIRLAGFLFSTEEVSILELKDGLKYLNDMLQTSENDEEKKLLEDIRMNWEKRKLKT